MDSLELDILVNTAILQKKFNVCIQKSLSQHLLESCLKIYLVRKTSLKGVIGLC